MLALAVIGWSGSGKTVLLTALLEVFKRRGLRVSSVKHAHHGIAFDTAGKDSFRHREAGATEVILASADGFALFSGQGDGDLPALLARLAPVDLVLVEGFKNYDLPKLEVHRPSLGRPGLWPEMEVLAVASDVGLVECDRPVLDLNAPEAVADFLMAALRLNTL